jgi:hypothetical protein
MGHWALGIGHLSLLITLPCLPHPPVGESRLRSITAQPFDGVVPAGYHIPLPVATTDNFVVKYYIACIRS